LFHYPDHKILISPCFQRMLSRYYSFVIVRTPVRNDGVTV
jgi:hypothetical protein